MSKRPKAGFSFLTSQFCLLNLLGDKHLGSASFPIPVFKFLFSETCYKNLTEAAMTPSRLHCPRRSHHPFHCDRLQPAESLVVHRQNVKSRFPLALALVVGATPPNGVAGPRLAAPTRVFAQCL